MKNEIKQYSLDEMKNKHIGPLGTKDRDEYEYELRMDLIGQMIREARKQRNLTQEALGKLVGVKRAQISKLENHANSARIETVVRVFRALEAEINFNVRMEDEYVELV